jgi:phytol kinase
MDRNILGIIIGFVFVFFMIFVATVLQKLFKMSNDFSRKIIHISVGNWIFLALFYFSEWYYAIVGPVAFVLINFLSYKFTIFKAMELEEKNPGTIYYPISLTICTFLTFIQKPHLTLPFLGILAMTWGDGFAAVIGQKYPLRQIRPGKSIGGSASFFLFTFLSSFIYLFAAGSALAEEAIFLISFAAGLLGTLIELFSPKNADNLTVPILLGLIGFVIQM